MLEVYSKGVAASANAPVALTTVSLNKGTSTQLIGASSIQLNKAGIYQVTVFASAIAGTADTISLQLRKNGVLQPQAEVSATAIDTTSIYPLGFTTLVQVAQNNCNNCPCSIPTIIDIVNTGVAATYDINVTVVRV